MTMTQRLRARRNLRILSANEREEDLRALGDVLDGLGHEVTPFAVSVAEAAELIAREDPDLAFVVLDGDDEHGLALISETVEFACGPVLVSACARPRAPPRSPARGHGDRRLRRLVGAGGRAGGDRVALRRHREEQRLNEKVAQLESALDRRALIERAKGILMERHGVDERRAFELLREHARSSGRRVVDVAQAVLDGHALLPKRQRSVVVA